MRLIHTLCHAGVLFVCLGLVGANAYNATGEEPKKVLPKLPKSKNYRALSERALAALGKAESIELYSLDPGADAKDTKVELFGGWKVLGKTELKGEKAKEVIKAIISGNKESDGYRAKCYEPRHGIRLKVDGKTIDVVICFACLLGYVSDGSERDEMFHTSRDPQELLNKILSDAKVPLPKSRNEKQ